MSNTNDNQSEDLYADGPEPQRVDAPPEIPKANGKLENIMALRNDPKARRGLILSGVGLGIAIIMLIIVVARMTNPPPAPLPPEIQGVNVGSAPGGFRDDAQGGVGNTQQFATMVDGISQERVAQAQADGTSVQPLAITIERDLRPVPQQQPAPPPQQVAYVAPTYQITQPPMQDPAYQAMLQNARMAVDSLVRSRELGTAVFDAPVSQNQAGAAQQSGQSGVAGGQNMGQMQGANQAAAPSQPQSVTMIAAGAVESVRVDTALNSDVGGEFVGTIVTGPYAGARLIGSAERVGTLLKPVFTLMSMPSTGISVPVNALGLDARTLENGTATDVDRKLFIKYGIQPLAAALSAVGEAIVNAGSTTVINGDATITSNPELDGRRTTGVAVGAAAETFTRDVGALNTEPTVRVAPGTVIGVVFTRDVVYTPR